MSWHHFSLYCASREPALGAKTCLCTGENQDACSWRQYNCTQDPGVPLICKPIHMCLPAYLIQKVEVPLSLPRESMMGSPGNGAWGQGHALLLCVGLGFQFAPCRESQSPPWSPSAEPKHPSSEMIPSLLICLCVAAMCFTAWEWDNKKREKKSAAINNVKQDI